jgi:gluconolactonase
MIRFLPILFFPVMLLAQAAPVFQGSIERLDPALDQLIAPEAKVEKLAEGFNWSEGPAWFEQSVVFSDVPENVIFRWKEGQTAATQFLKPSGLLTPQPGFREPGSNGLAVDAQGRLLLCQHGERRIARLEKDGTQTALADRFEGKRFNSPNDLAIRRNGEIYFTDPPYGMEGGDRSPLKELAWNGVYRLDSAGKVSLLIKDLTFPNGIGFSPDERTLYVAVSDGKAPRVMAYEVQADGSVGAGRVFIDALPLGNKDRRGSCDGLKVDAAGNVFATGPGGVLIYSAAGKHLGTILTGQATGNCAWGDDGSTLYICADAFLCRVKTRTRAAHWPK